MSTEIRRHVEQLAVARLGAGADLPSWVSSATLMSITATAESTTVVCSAGAVPRKARPEGPFAAYEVVPDAGASRAAALATALAALPEEAEVRVVGTVDHDWLLVPVGAVDLVAEQWTELGLDVVDAPAPAPPERPDRPERPERRSDDRKRDDRSPTTAREDEPVSITHPAGFRAAGVAAGLKSTGARDVALVVNDGPTHDSASVFTANRCKANPVLWSQEVVKDGVVRAVFLNSGGANCYTGPEGFATTHAVAERVAEHAGIGAGDVVVCSTGLIGLTNDRATVLAGADAAYDALAAGGGDDAAHAIMTTDSISKQVVVEGAGWSVGGMAKGAGMLAPQLATMLVVITTDAVVPAADLDQALRAATRVSFDRLDSDGCMSTNDTVTVLASGASGITPALPDFTEALTQACTDLALQLLKDAEGADHEIAITTLGAVSEDEAVEVSRSVARSNLFKAAVFGKDPNWGRVLASIGTTAATFDPGDLDVAINGVWVCRESTPAADPADVDLEPREVTVTIDLKSGGERATVWTNDLTHAYVHENSAYSS